jgi:dihydrolipoamide dehydrogenase
MVVGDASIDIDVLVIGAGPGGYVAAIRCAQLGKKVMIVDKDAWGGVCLNRGCIPSKAIISAAHQYEQVKQAQHIGITATDVQLDFRKTQSWKKSIIDKQSSGVKTLLKGNAVQMFQGEALFINEHEVRLFNDHESLRYRFRHGIIATGSRPIELKAFPFGGRILSSTEALNLNEVPQRLIVIGGGYIGIEIGQAYAKLGAKVTILENSDYVLASFEKELTKLIASSLDKLGVEVITEAKALHSQQTDQEVTITYSYSLNGEEKHIVADYALVTVGRKPNTDGDLGLELLQMKVTDRGYIEVDAQCRTSIPHLFAIGDIVAGPALAHKASYEGKVVAEVIAGQHRVVDYKVIPAVVFSDPEIATVGLSESEAKAQEISVKIGKFPYAANGRANSLNATQGFVKLIANEKSGILIGAQIVGPEASNLIGELALGIELGAHLEDIALTIHAHPTLTEMVMDAAEGALGHPIHQLVKQS